MSTIRIGGFTFNAWNVRAVSIEHDVHYALMKNGAKIKCSQDEYERIQRKLKYRAESLAAKRASTPENPIIQKGI